MIKKIPLIAEKAPNVVMEVIFRLKIKDAMTSRVCLGKKEHTLYELQQKMKKKGISGIPIAEEKGIVGIISVNDIITALDKGHIKDKAEEHMTRDVKVLEDDMPLTFAISYFNKYSFRRFPVINKDKKIVGIISSKDILVAIVNEMNKEIRNLESKLEKKKAVLPEEIVKNFEIKKHDFENAGHPSFKLKKLLKEKNIPKKIIRRASIAAYELEINLTIHSDGGEIKFMLDNDKIVIETIDNGPGIENVEKVLEEGFSTANDWIRSLGFGAGMGIPNTKRVSGEFEINSRLGEGTKVRSVIYLERKQ